MAAFNAEAFAIALAIIGVVIIIAALLSGLVERSGLPQVGVFLTLGAALSAAYVVVACWFFARVHRHAVQTGLLARYSAESVS